MKDLFNPIIYVELMAVGCEILEEAVPLHEAWVLLTGYDHPVVPKMKDKRILDRLRILLPQIMGKTIWESMVDEYFEIPQQHRLLNRNENGDISFLDPRFDPSRRSIYEEILRKPIPKIKNKQKFIGEGKFSYTKKKGAHLITFKGTIPSGWNKETDNFPLYRDKKKLSFDLPFDWVGIAKEMDEVTAEGEATWQQKVRPMALISTKDMSKFKFEGIQHISGGLAAGKSTFRTVSTYWLTQIKHAKVGIVETSVAQVLEQVKELRALGLNAVPLIGRNGRKNHQDNYLLSNPLHSIADVETDQSLSSLSAVCTIKALAGDNDEEKATRLPCKSINKNGEKGDRKCSLAHLCGIYNEWTELLEADVWVTTSAAVLHTRLPANIDPYERLIYEAMYDLLDVIYVDEADQIQKQFDETFLKELSAFGQSNYFFESMVRELSTAIGSNYGFADDQILMEMRKTCNHVEAVIWELFQKIKESVTLRDSIENRILYVNYLIHEISEALSETEGCKERIADNMRKFVRESNFSSVGSVEERLHTLINVSKSSEKVAIIEAWMTRMKVGIPVSKIRDKLYAKIEVFVYLAHIESAMKFIMRTYPSIQSSLTRQLEIPMLRHNKEFNPFIKEAMTGVMLGYRYEVNDGEELGTFKMIQYTSVGRELLAKWPFIYEHADEKKGPVVILLSGTSYAPESLHYHIDGEPDWFIESSRQQSTLMQNSLIIRDPENEEKPMAVSGIKTLHKRQENLKKIVLELETHFEKELTHWGNIGEKRRILLVVNSYEDVEVVGTALEMSTKWKNRFRLLSQENKKDEVWYPRSTIEQFYNVDADILVAPMLAISRGYNIMDEKGEGALFGSAYFLIRPYPIPNDLSYFVQMLHGNLPYFLDDIDKENLVYGDAMRKLRTKSRGLFEVMYRKPEFWSLLSEKERIVLAWYTFIPTWQLIGRLLRGGKNARIFYCDAKFHQTNQGTPSLLEYWEKLMTNHDDPLFNSLYGPFKNSIHEAMKEGVYY